MPAERSSSRSLIDEELPCWAGLRRRGERQRDRGSTASASSTPLAVGRGTGYPVAPMHRRYAILDDNQQLLEERIARLRRLLPALIADRACAVALIGSVAEGRARDGSDIDLLLVLRAGGPRRTDYTWWDTVVAPEIEHAGTTRRFPVQPVIVGRAALATTEPHLRRALACALPLWDPEGLVHDQPEART